MNDRQLLERITSDARVMVGKPVIGGTRLTVEYILGLLAHGATIEGVIEEYPGLTADVIRACVRFAARALEDMTFMPLAAENK